MSPILCRIGQSPHADHLADELIDRILVALILDLEVDLLFHSDGLEWLQPLALSGHHRARFGLLELYGIGRLLAHDPDALLPTEAVDHQVLGSDELRTLTSGYRSIW